jgi:hypothetical protein
MDEETSEVHCEYCGCETDQSPCESCFACGCLQGAF